MFKPGQPTASRSPGTRGGVALHCARVTIHTAQPGRIVTPADLDELGLVAPKEEFARFIPAPVIRQAGQLAELPDNP